LPPAKAEEFMKRLGDDAADEWVFGARRPAAAAGSRLVLVVSRRTRRRQVAFDVGRSAHGGACRDVTNTTLASQCAPLRGRAKQPRVWAKSASSVPQAKRVLFQDLCLTSTGVKSTPAKRGLLWASRVSRTAKRMFSSDDEAEGGVRLNLAMGDSVSRQQGPPPDPPARRTLMGAREPGKR